MQNKLCRVDVNFARNPDGLRKSSTNLQFNSKSCAKIGFYASFCNWRRSKNTLKIGQIKMCINIHIGGCYLATFHWIWANVSSTNSNFCKNFDAQKPIFAHRNETNFHGFGTLWMEIHKNFLTLYMQNFMKQ